MKEAEAAEDLELIKSSLEELEQATHALSKAMYEAQASEEAGGDSPPDGAAAESDEGEVIDAEFEKKE